MVLCHVTLKDDLQDAIQHYRNELPIDNSIVAEFLVSALDAFDDAVQEHERLTGSDTTPPGIVRWKIEVQLTY